MAKRAVKSQVNYFERSHLKSQPKYLCNWHTVRSMGRKRNIVILNLVKHEVSIWIPTNLELLVETLHPSNVRTL